MHACHTQLSHEASICSDRKHTADMDIPAALHVAAEQTALHRKAASASGVSLREASAAPALD